MTRRHPWPKSWSAACCLAALVPAVPAMAESAALEAGAYEVEVKLELPHLEDTTTKKTTRICLPNETGADHHGLAVLSDNNPLARCPILNVREDGRMLTFEIACPGKNAARATARYVLAPQSFQGRIVMQMGGKNMTMTESQAGRRIGACQDGKAPWL